MSLFPSFFISWRQPQATWKRGKKEKNSLHRKKEGEKRGGHDQSTSSYSYTFYFTRHSLWEVKGEKKEKKLRERRGTRPTSRFIPTSSIAWRCPSTNGGREEKTSEEEGKEINGFSTRSLPVLFLSPLQVLFKEGRKKNSEGKGKKNIAGGGIRH